MYNMQDGDWGVAEIGPEGFLPFPDLVEIWPSFCPDSVQTQVHRLNF